MQGSTEALVNELVRDVAMLKQDVRILAAAANRLVEIINKLGEPVGYEWQDKENAWVVRQFKE